MKRLLRILRITSLTLSLLICLTSLFMWHRSLSYWDLFTIRIGRHHITINTYPDAALLVCGHRQAGPPGELSCGHYPQHHPLGDKVVNHQYRWGMRWFSVSRTQWLEARLTPEGVTYRGFQFAASFWSIALFTFLLPALFFVFRLRRTLKRRHLRRSGLCPHCGYDLRASPNLCPECGTLIQTNQNPKPSLPAPR
jgi:hypothetical protein